MFTINNGNKMISAIHNDKHYAIGFKNAMLARHVQYNLFHNTKYNIDPIVYINKYQKNKIEVDISPIIDMFNTNEIIDHDENQTSIAFYTETELYMQKMTPRENQNLECPYHIDIIPTDDFMCYPIDKLIGLVLPEEVIEEDDNLLIFKCQMIDPFYIPQYYKRQLLKMKFEES